MVDRNAGVPPERRIEFRIGVHLGDVVEENDGDLMGDGVNIAARLEAIAAPGAICLSEQAYWQVKGRLDIAVTDLGPTQPKNIAEPIRVYSLEVGAPAQPRPAAAPSPETRGAAPRLSIVVLPFANIGGDPEQEHFVDGITESLTTDLSRIRGAYVVVATATRRSPTRVSEKCVRLWQKTRKSRWIENSASGSVQPMPITAFEPASSVAPIKRRRCPRSRSSKRGWRGRRTMRVLVGLRSPKHLAAPLADGGEIAVFGRMVVILTRLSKVMPAAFNCASEILPGKVRLCSTMSSRIRSSILWPTCPLIYSVRVAPETSIACV